MSSTDLIMGAAGVGGGGDKTYVDDVFSTYLYTGNGSSQTINNGIQLGDKELNAASYTSPGTYTWVAPAGVTSVSVVCVGAGGANAGGSGGGGGELRYKNNIAVVPGNSYTVVVGNNPSNGSGGQSTFNGETVVANGGLGGSAGSTGGFGGVGDGGGNGGSGAEPASSYGSGGGAGGYSGNGGNGGNGSTAPTAGSGGGGGGGAAYTGNNYLVAYGGGGVGLFGQGANGATGGFGGSGGSPGQTTAVGGNYGGGGGAANGSTLVSASGGSGAVRIVWPGNTRQFPNTDVTATVDPGEGGLVWIKERDDNGAHFLFDTVRGALNAIRTNTTGAQSTVANSLTSFNSDGFTLGSYGDTNASSTASWTFRKAPKFFDVVTYTGTGSARTISHNLGSAPGMILVKRLNSSIHNWMVYHRSLPSAAYYLSLNTTDAQDVSSSTWSSTAPTSSVFSVGSDANVNESGGTYVAYLFAHDAGGFGDAGTDNVISCGSFTTDGTGKATVSLGYEPQYLLTKKSSTTGNWQVSDVMRGMNLTASTAGLFPNLSNAEAVDTNFIPNATGFTGSALGASATYIYMAIRRPMKPPTSGTEVFAPSTWTSNSSSYTGIFIDSGFPVDLSILGFRNQPYGAGYFADRLRGFTNPTSSSTTGSQNLESFSTSAEYASSNTFGGDSNTGVKHNGMTNSTTTEVNWNFRRATGFFDVVCYTGTGTTSRNISHNLGVFPEMVIVKRRSSAGNWWVDHNNAGSGNVLYLNRVNAAFSYTAFGTHTSTTIQLETVANNDTNQSGGTYVAYLFASVAGVSKVGSYTGTGTNTDNFINCGFSAGARFILIKRTDFAGDWLVFDTARGITTGNDPLLRLNTTVAESTGLNLIEPYSTGFNAKDVSGAGTMNSSGANYIYLAIA